MVKVGILVLFLISGEVSSVLPLNILAVGFSYMILIMMRQFPYIPTSLSVLSLKVLNFTKCFFCIRHVHVVFALHSVNVVLLIWLFSHIKPPLLSGDKSHLVISVILSVCCWVWFLSILLGIFTLQLIKDTSIFSI